MPSTVASCPTNPNAVLNERRLLPRHGCAVRVEQDQDELVLSHWPLSGSGAVVEEDVGLAEWLSLDEDLDFWETVDAEFRTSFARVHVLRELGTTEAALDILSASPYRFADDQRTWQGRNGAGWQCTLLHDGTPVAVIHQDGYGGQCDIQSLGGEAVESRPNSITADFQALADRLPPNNALPDLGPVPHDWDSVLTLLNVLCQFHLLD